MKLRVATPLGLSCTLPPSCFTFFSLCSFRLYLDSVWFASARQCSDPERSSLSLPLSFSLVVSLSQGPSPLQPLATITGPHGYQPLVFTSDQVGGDFDKTTSELRYPPSSSPSAHCAARQFDSQGTGRGKKRTEDSAGIHVKRRGLHIEKHGAQETWVHRG